jgi:uncharacterized protein YgbK (DUF1537 family)
VLQCVVVADDLTGSNATGVLLRKTGFPTCTVLNEQELRREDLEQYTCAVFPTNSRSIDAKEAYGRVYRIVESMKSERIRLFSKRVDSTLRGNLGSETDAMLDALGEDTAAIVAPCFPSAGRILLGGFLLVGTTPLHRTEAAIDPTAPVHTSSIKQIFDGQSQRKSALITIEDLRQGETFVAEKIRALHRGGVRIILVDGASQEDIDLTAGAAVSSGIPFITVDPGPFTAAAAKRLIAAEQEQDKKSKGGVLGVIGSVNPVAQKQVEEFLHARKAFCEYVNTRKLLDDSEKAGEIERVVSAVLRNCGDFDKVLVVGDGIFPQNRLDFAELETFGMPKSAACERINDALAEIALRLIEGRGFSGLYTSGGDITIAVTKRMRCAGIALCEEVIPLAACGEISGGAFSGMKIVTKGGMAGDRNALITCLDYLLKKTQEEQV